MSVHSNGERATSWPVESPWQMHDQYGFLLKAFFKRYFSRIGFDAQEVRKLQELGRQGTIVWVMESASLVNYLFLNYWLCRNELPLAYFGNDIPFLPFQPLRRAISIAWSLLKAVITSGKRAFDVRSYVMSVVRQGKSVVLFLKVPSFRFIRSPMEPKSYVHTLVALQQELQRPLYLVPIGILWGKRPEKAQKSIIDILFGVKDTPRLLRHLIVLVRQARNSIVMIGEVIHLKDYVASHVHLDQALLVKKVRWALVRELTVDRHVVTGPTLKPRKFMIASVISSRTLRDTAQAIAREEGRPFDKVIKEAERYAQEIIADYNFTYIEFLDWIFTWVWNNIYSGFYIDKEGLERLRKTAKHASLILLPCHRSHVDYLVLSYVCYHHNLPPPHIAAGVNLSFWPLGHIFRKAGAFFIRRSIRGQRLYAAVFSAYLRKLLKEGYVQEFFLEGTRSRTGKLLQPRLGMLGMEIDAFAEGACEELSLVPIAITYERVVEEASYTHEAAGAVKRKERLADLLKTPRFLFKKYGRVYIQVAPPISVRAVFREHKVEPSEPDVELRRKIVREIGHRVSFAINDVMTVTPSSIVATVLLNHTKRGIARGELSVWASLLLDVLKDIGARISLTLRNVQWALDEALGVFVVDGLVRRYDDPEGTIFMVEEAKRINLDYYKNNILHFFLPCSFAGNVFLMYGAESLDVAELRTGLTILTKIFQREFIFPPHDPVETYRTKLHEYLVVKKGFLSVDASGRYHRADPTIMSYFSRLLFTLCESYVIVFRTLERMGHDALDERLLMRQVLATADRLLRRGDVLRWEARSVPTFRNAIDLCLDLGLLKRVETKGGERRLLLNKEPPEMAQKYRMYLERILSAEG